MAACTMLLGCVPPAEKSFRKFQSNVKASIDPAKLQEWGVPLAAQHETGYQIRTQELPANVREIQMETYPEAFVTDGSAAVKRVITITFGSGFGHWGIFVGSKEYELPGSDSHLEIINWVPGVYFFREKT